MAIEFRILAQHDADIFSRVADEVFDHPPDPRRVAAYLASDGHVMMVALDDGEVVGQIAAVVHRHPDQPTELYIDNLGVTPRLQRQGIAREMLNRMLEFGRSIGCEEAWVATEPDNVAARTLYETHGAEAEPFVMYVYAP